MPEKIVEILRKHGAVFVPEETTYRTAPEVPEVTPLEAVVFRVPTEELNACRDELAAHLREQHSDVRLTNEPVGRIIQGKARLVLFGRSEPVLHVLSEIRRLWM